MFAITLQTHVKEHILEVVTSCCLEQNSLITLEVDMVHCETIQAVLLSMNHLAKIVAHHHFQLSSELAILVGF